MHGAAQPAVPAVAILAWGDIFVDWLDRLGVSFQAFRDELVGSWMFGYAAALQRSGVHPVIVGVTRRVQEPLTATHGPTGATIHLLPPPRVERPVRARALGGSLNGRRDVGSLARAALGTVAPYLATPPLALAGALRAHGCAAVLCQEYETPRFDLAVLLGRILRVPTFATFQGGDYQLSRLERPIRPLSLRAASGVIVGTRSEADRLRRQYRLNPGRIARVFNPVDTDVWRPRDRRSARADLGLAEDVAVVVWHGQVQRRRKGLDILLRAWATVVAERPERDLQLLLVGAGEDVDEIRRAAPASVRLLDGWVLDPTRLAQLLGAGDVYAFPSRHEGFPVAPVEALACGLPVVAADAHGVRDILEAGEAHGGVVVDRDDPMALAHELGRLLDDGERRAVLGAAARRRAEEAFSPAAVGSQLRRLLLEDRPPTPAAGPAR